MRLSKDDRPEARSCAVYFHSCFGYFPLFVMMGGFHLIAWTFVHIYLGDMTKLTDNPVPAT